MVNALSTREADLVSASRLILQYFKNREKGLQGASDGVLFPRLLSAALESYTDVPDISDSTRQAVRRSEDDDPIAHDVQNIHMAVAGFVEEVVKAQTVNRCLRLSRLLKECIAALEAAQFAAMQKADEVNQ